MLRVINPMQILWHLHKWRAFCPSVDGQEPTADPRWILAQLYAESGLNADAVSDAGAQGIAQFMLDTWAWAQEKGWVVKVKTPYDWKPATVACVRYMQYLMGEWSWPRPGMDRLQLAQASYNAGLGNILAAQKLADNAVLYHQIMEKLPEVTGEDNARETTEYVKRIWKQYVLYVTEGV